LSPPWGRQRTTEKDASGKDNSFHYFADGATLHFVASNINFFTIDPDTQQETAAA
jgi:hypothetical protein